jgi:formylglycine-generating enzyme required for sulfatase activity
MPGILARRRCLLALPLASVAAVALLAPCAEGHGGAKFALVVGVNRYQHAELGPLEYAESDAKELASELKRSGYRVDLLTGEKATRAAIVEKLKSFAKKGEARGVLVVGLAGHGIQPEGDRDAYFCPYDAGQKVIDAGGKKQADWDTATMLPLSEVLAYLKVSPVGAKALLVDACRNDPKSGRGRGFGSSLNVGDFPRNLAVLLSCSEGQRSFEDRKWRHGAFFYHVLEGLRDKAVRKGKVTALTLGAYVKDAVEEEVPEVIGGGAKQRPQLLISGHVDFQVTREKVVKAEGKAITNSIGMKLVRIPAGKFHMGSPTDEPDRYADEARHEVEITRAFWLGAHEVTQRQFKEVMGYNPSFFSRDGTGKRGMEYRYGKPAGGKDMVPADTSDFPVENVSHSEAEEFCKKLTLQEAKHGQKYRLPTEAEWEYACRAGTTRRFHSGDDEDDLKKVAWYWKNSGGRTHQVGTKKANAFGLYDMHGNVWEWCADWYDEDYYGKSPRCDPLGPSVGSGRVVRGGGWRHSTQWRRLDQLSRSALRQWDRPALRDFDLGFRVALVPSR